MKNLRLFQILFLTLFVISCSSDDGENGSPIADQGIVATIDGGTYSNYSFVDGIYNVTKGTNGNTLTIESADINGDIITLFLNGIGGFSQGVVKQVGDTDSNNFKTYTVIRQLDTELSYFALEEGNVTITANRAHPTDNGHRLITGTFNVTATSTLDNHTTTMTGSFSELDYVD